MKYRQVAGCFSPIRTTYLLNTNQTSVSQPSPLISTPDCSRSCNIALYIKWRIIAYRLCWHVRYLTSLSSVQIIWCRIVVCLLNHELESVWKETDVPVLRPSPDIYVGELRKSKKNLVMIVFVPAYTPNVHLGHGMRNVMAWNKLLGVNYDGTSVFYLFV